MKRLGPIAAAIVADVRFRRKVERLHRRGPRAILEVLAEIAAGHSNQNVVEQVLDRHLGVPEQALEAVGGDRLPPVPIRAVTDDEAAA